LYTHFPSASWYVLLDDDTFVAPANLKALLRRFSPDKSLYMGRVMFAPILVSDGTTKLEAFAHGGSGVVLSAGLMRAFEPHLREQAESGTCASTG
jgi:hypothetical protein